jgi:argonaute-like protein implicated in RNA metabolism and viral defense
MREQKDENEYFDLHDSLKLYCAKKGIVVQIIEERSVEFSDTAKVMWGLSTGIYAKTSGQLWRPKEFNQNTAFVGLSYAQYGKDKNEYAIGCSQLFDSAGNGMRLLLKPIYNPKIIRNNPFMRETDAFKMLSQLKNIYCDSVPFSKLKRIVIHKTTFFTNDEIAGISQGLEGIDDIELLQIQEFTGWRAIRFASHNIDSVDKYPIKRGTVIPIDDFSFLLWTHGSVMSDDLAGAKKNYYKGGRGIPAPLLVRRYLGKASGETIVREILMLTKMNWNSGDSLYKKLPVTLDFAKILSQMAKQKEALYNKPYDFRFFM